MKKKNVKYLILCIFFGVLIGCSVYYFKSLTENDKYLDTFIQDENNKFDNNESDNKKNENNDSELNEEDSNNLNTDSQNNNKDIFVDEDSIDNNLDSNDNNIDDSSINNESNYFKDLNINDFISLVDNKDDFILVISQTWCSHCTNYKPKVEKVANSNKVVVYYIEYNMLSENDKNIFNGYIEFSGTPTTVFFKDGVEVVDARIAGDTTEDKIESIIKNNGYIK